MSTTADTAMKMKKSEGDGEAEWGGNGRGVRLDGYHEKLISLQTENSQLRSDLVRQSRLYYHVEQQLDIWLSEKASLQSCVDDMHDRMVLSAEAIRGVVSSDRCSANAEGRTEAFESVRSSQSLVQILLELGEAFLVSKLDEEGFRELQTRIAAAISRDKSVVQQLQEKIGELSEMGAMVTKLKHELREEKEKAQEEAEDLTQEMAELRYQLMEMLDRERELRSNVEHASLHRISELEEQLKHACEEIKAALEARQAAEIQAEVRTQEIDHLKSILQAKYEEEEQELQFTNEQHIGIIIGHDEKQESTETGLGKMRTLKCGHAGNKQVSEDYLQLIQEKLENETELKYKELYRSFEEALHSLSLVDVELYSSKIEGEQQELFHSAQGNVPSSSGKKEVINCSIKKFEEKFKQQSRLLEWQKGEVESLKQVNEELIKRASGFESESLALNQQVSVLESHANEMRTTIMNLEDALLLENLKATQVQEDYNLQAERFARQDEDYFTLKIKSNELLNTLASLQKSLGETRKKEREAQGQVKRLELELSVAKEEVVKSEVRIQRILKQAQDEVDSEKRRVDATGNLQKQIKWFLEKQHEKLERTQSEKAELLTKVENLKKKLEQNEKEKDELKVAYAELENQFARTAFAK